jgi:tRNA(His) 5'-end guanylyltransferase
MARLDGRSFHTFTRKLNRPFDERLTRCMVEATKFMVEETGAIVGYTQSDEISLVWHSNDLASQIFFGGRVLKMASVLSAMVSVEFNRLVREHLPEKANQAPVFDCRVWNVPTRTEAVNAFIWRELDATKNAISMAAQAVFSHKELQGKSGKEKQEMLFKKGVNFNDYPAAFKRGTYIRKRTESRRFSTEEIDRLPLKHAARSNPNLMVERSVISVLPLEPLVRIVNREAVLFEGANPEY